MGNRIKKKAKEQGEEQERGKERIFYACERRNVWLNIKNISTLMSRTGKRVDWEINLRCDTNFFRSRLSRDEWMNACMTSHYAKLSTFKKCDSASSTHNTTGWNKISENVNFVFVEGNAYEVLCFLTFVRREELGLRRVRDSFICSEKEIELSWWIGIEMKSTQCWPPGVSSLARGLFTHHTTLTWPSGK